MAAEHEEEDLLAQLYQGNAQQRCMAGIETAFPILLEQGGEARLLFLLAEILPIVACPGKWDLPLDNLERLRYTIPEEACPQDCMALDYLLKGLLQSLYLEGTLNLPLHLGQVDARLWSIEGMEE